MSEEEKELPTFTFDIRREGQQVPVGAFKAAKLEHAVREARKQCKSFTLPGWELVCRETGACFPAVQFKTNTGKVFK